MRKIGLLLFAAIMCSSVSSWGWGKTGHGLVAEVAFTMLDSATKARVHEYISDMSIEQAANWMDDVRSDHKYDYMKPWHYVNVEKGGTYQETKDANAVTELTIAINELQHRDKLDNDQVRKDILVVMHLTGDLHQPLHVGYGEDKGGNDVQVRYNDHGTNLHRVWDSEIIEKEHITLSDCMMKMRSFDKEDKAMLSKLDVAAWMRQPRSQLKSVYDFKDGAIDDAYVQRNKNIIEEDIAIAGIRLAAILNSAFKS